MTSRKRALALAFFCCAPVVFGQPRIFDISTNSARIGDDVIILGDDLNPAEAKVSIGGAQAQIMAGNVAYLQVRVPGGALPGPISISQGGKVASSSTYFNPLPATPGVITNVMALRTINRYAFQLFGVVADLDGDSKPDVI